MEKTTAIVVLAGMICLTLIALTGIAKNHCTDLAYINNGYTRETLKGCSCAIWTKK